MISIKIRPIASELDGEAFVDIDLFDDESIEVSLSVKQASSIGDILADFSKTFTVPATRKNNAIFRHFYRSDIIDGVGYVRGIPAAIYINGDEFRTGVINLQDSLIKDGDPYAYTLQFFSSIQKLNDIGDIQLGQLDFSALDHDYTSTNIRAGMRGTLNNTTDLVYPLASTVTYWEYDSTPSNHRAYNIAYHTGHSGNQHGVNYRELKPAISFKVIMEAIKESLGIEFSGSFYSGQDSPLDKVYMWLNTNEGFMNVTTPHERVLLNGGVNVTSDRLIRIEADPNNRRFFRRGDQSKVKLTVRVNVSSISGGGACTVYLKKGYNGTIAAQKTVSSPIQVELIDENSAKDDFYYIEVSSFVPQTITIGDIYIYADKSGIFTNYYSYLGGFSINYKPRVKPARLMPDMSAVEFIDGVAKMFNLAITYDGDDSFNLTPLQDLYNSGKVFDLNDFVDTSDVLIQPSTRYKSYNLKYDDSEQSASELFRSQYQREYGEMQRTNNSNIKEELKVEVPFEIPSMDVLGNSGNEFPVFFSVKNIDGFDRTTGACESYFDKPTIFYVSGEVINLTEGNRVSLIDESGNEFEIAQLLYFGLLDTYDNPQKSLGFTFDPSFHPYNAPFDTTPTSTQFTNYWEGTINTIDSPYSRIVSVKGVMNIADISRINITDIVKFGELVYTIDSFNINLTTGEFDIKLLTRI